MWRPQERSAVLGVGDQPQLFPPDPKKRPDWPPANVKGHLDHHFEVQPSSRKRVLGVRVTVLVPRGWRWEWSRVEYPSPGLGPLYQLDRFQSSRYHILWVDGQHQFDLFDDGHALESCHRTLGWHRDESLHNHLHRKHPVGFAEENISPTPV